MAKQELDMKKKDKMDNKSISKDLGFGMSVRRSVGTFDGKPYDTVKLVKKIFPKEIEKGEIVVRLDENLSSSIVELKSMKL